MSRRLVLFLVCNYIDLILVKQRLWQLKSYSTLLVFLYRSSTDLNTQTSTPVCIYTLTLQTLKNYDPLVTFVNFSTLIGHPQTVHYVGPLVFVNSQHIFSTVLSPFLKVFILLVFPYYSPLSLGPSHFISDLTKVTQTFKSPVTSWYSLSKGVFLFSRSV